MVNAHEEDHAQEENRKDNHNMDDEHHDIKLHGSSKTPKVKLTIDEVFGQVYDGRGVFWWE